MRHEFFLFCVAATFALPAAASQPPVPDCVVTAETKGSALVIRAKPPSGHHFNVKAPLQLSLADGSTVTPSVLLGDRIEFAASLGEAESLHFTAHLYVCDNPVTYCVPQRLHFTWDGGKKRLGRGKGEVSKDAPGASVFITDIGSAFAEAERSKRPLLALFSVIWCPPCNRLNEETFPSEEFLSRAKRFVLLKADGDDPAFREIKARYAVSTYPTILFLTPDGEEAARAVNFRSPSSLAMTMDKVLKGPFTGLARLKMLAERNDLAAKGRLGEILLERGDIVEAERYLAEAVRSGSAEASVREKYWEARIAVLSAGDDKARGRDALGEALEASLAEFPQTPGAIDRRMALAEIYRRQRNRPRLNEQLTAIVALIEALQKDPASLSGTEWAEDDLFRALADTRSELGDGRGYRETYEAYADTIAKKMDGRGAGRNSRGLGLNLAQANRELGRIDEAMAIYRRFQKEYPQEFTFHFAEGALLAKLKRYAEAEPCALRAFEASYGDNRLLSADLLGNVLMNLGRHKEALEAVRAALQEVKGAEANHGHTERFVEKLRRLERQLSSHLPSQAASEQ